ncbi:hypothetical protein ITP53_26020 [Nonomuraea sp. K274]|uniref:Minor tail protein n=1 Tax=Nonomuraea cypriaca TaxID=1187855 RepID=A0A931F2K2_9ACTN|nr:hypothetical protein [Nonomuraea cypriaca]MBF8189126.1 hypothetical protein [Nonomuraea cypriaca]
MALTTNYLQDLSRVRVEGTSIVGSTVTVEKSTDGVTWSLVRGGSSVAVFGGAFTLDDYEFPAGIEVTYRVGSETSSVTVNLTTVWIKAILHPFLNRPATVVDWSSVGREFRGGVFPVVGRSFPVSVTDLRGARRYTLEVATHSPTAAEDLDYLLASGGPVFIHTPADSSIPGVYAVIVGSDERRAAMRSDRRIFTLELQEVAKPGVDVVGATTIWQSIVNEYVSWNEVITEFATWADVLDSTSDASSVIVQ